MTADRLSPSCGDNAAPECVAAPLANDQDPAASALPSADACVLRVPIASQDAEHAATAEHESIPRRVEMDDAILAAAFAARLQRARVYQVFVRCHVGPADLVRAVARSIGDDVNEASIVTEAETLQHALELLPRGIADHAAQP